MSISVDISPARDDPELEELERVQGLLDEAHDRLRSLVKTLASLDIRAEHTPDGWMVLDERVEEALRLPAV